MGSGQFCSSTDTTVANRAAVFFEWETFRFRMFFLKMLLIQVAGSATVNATAAIQENLSDPVLGAAEVAQTLLQTYALSLIDTLESLGHPFPLLPKKRLLIVHPLRIHLLPKD
jgi:hypothetical protein